MTTEESASVLNEEENRFTVQRDVEVGVVANKYLNTILYYCSQWLMKPVFHAWPPKI
jgi:hypothetical protein